MPPRKINWEQLKELLEAKYKEVNQPGFIKDDPIVIPHQFVSPQDIEIAGFFASILAWGNRTTIINKCNELLSIMDYAPYDFIRNHQESDLMFLRSFKHRTFNDTDTLYFVEVLNKIYQEHRSLEDIFLKGMKKNDENVYGALSGFQEYFFEGEHPARTRKHISSPAKGSACKRLNMYLRWMVRQDKSGVDFGIWKRLKPAQLVCPCDVHVDRVARQLGLIKRKQTDWQTAIELTENLKKMDAKDPVKYDFALFGIGLESKLKRKKIFSGA